MNKTVLIGPFCLVMIAGCVMSDNSETESDKVAVLTPVDPSENSLPPTSLVSEAGVRPTTARTLSQEEIRQLQIRLKEVGFDPGPTDGVPGTRTRMAFGRLQTSCAAWKSTAGNSTGREASALDGKSPASRKDIQIIQTRLRRAGFESGPIDGILGMRTKTVLITVENICPKIKEFAENLSLPVSISETQKSAAFMSASGFGPQESTRPSNSVGATKQTSTPAAAQAQEEIRILQLRLRDAGFDPGPFDGIMGPKTRSALQQYEVTQRGKKNKISLTTREAASHY